MFVSFPHFYNDKKIKNNLSLKAASDWKKLFKVKDDMMKLKLANFNSHFVTLF